MKPEDVYEDKREFTEAFLVPALTAATDGFIVDGEYEKTDWGETVRLYGSNGQFYPINVNLDSKFAMIGDCYKQLPMLMNRG